MQRAACGTLVGASETTTQGQQEDRLLFIAKLVDATIRTRLLNDTTTSDSDLNRLLQDKLVYAAKLASSC